jgi:hypothetical protein
MLGGTAQKASRPPAGAELGLRESGPQARIADDGIYGHRDQTDLETAMDAYARWLEQQREDEIVPPEADR